MKPDRISLPRKEIAFFPKFSPMTIARTGGNNENNDNNDKGTGAVTLMDDGIV
jgi:hypothetical protein